MVATMKYNLFAKFCLAAALVIASFSPAVSSFVPVTGAAPVAPQSAYALAAARPLVSTISAAGAFSFPVVQQPAGQPGYVSSTTGKVTEFGMALKYGSQGFLAHNNLAGASFFSVEVGDVITLTYADGSTDNFEVTQIRRLQAVSPNSPTSRFIDLDNNNASLTAVDLFYQTYGVKDTLVLQTCIAKGDQLSWGRLFIVANPVTLVSAAQ
jgi:hypothetical protein